MSSNLYQLIDWQNLKRLALAMLFSVLLHLLLLDRFDWRLIGLNALSDTLDDIRVELVSPPPAPVMVRPQPVSKMTVQDAPRRNASTVRPSPPPAISDNVENNAVLPMASDNPLVQMATQADSGLAASEQVSDNAPVNQHATELAEVLKPDDEPTGLTPEQLNQLPTQIDMLFDVLRNGKIGEANVHFRRSTDGHYLLTSERQATGLAAAFVKARDIEKSEGLVTRTGLNPTSFTHQFGKDGNKQHQASFDWAAAKLTLQENTASSVVDLPAGTQDMLSFMYQFMFVPPLTEMQIIVTNGRKVNHYPYRFEGEEDIQTGLGKVKTLHIAKSSNEGEGKLELWLGIDYHYLPMKIRKIDKDDKVYEQVINTLAAK
jgi:hypothetical protein